MSSLIKLLIGGIATVIFTWFLYGPMGCGAKCEAANAASGVVEEETATAGPAVAPAMSEEAVANCQAQFDTAISDKKINFGSGNAVIDGDSVEVINAVAAAANDCPAGGVLVAGHTDQQGDDGLNMKLSEARAAAVVAALVESGVSANRLTSKGLGETQLLDEGTSPESLAKNRRIEFTVVAGSDPITEQPAQ